jgi:hypothetical protein
MAISKTDRKEGEIKLEDRKSNPQLEGWNFANRARNPGLLVR